MSISKTELDARAQDVEVSADTLIVQLSDGRSISAPIAWFPRLAAATRDQRLHWKILGDGEGIRWPDIDEDISVAGLLRGTASG